MTYPAGSKTWYPGYEPRAAAPRISKSGAMQRRIRIGQALQTKLEGMTLRQIGAITGMTTTSINNDLQDMEMMKLVERAEAPDDIRRGVKSSKWIWRLRDLNAFAVAAKHDDGAER